MSLNNPKSGPNHVAEYQISALPWASSSTTGAANTVSQIDFPYITQFIAVMNTSASGTLYVGFTSSGALGANRIALTTGTAFSADYRIKSLFIAANSGSTSFQVAAGLTVIDRNFFPTLTGSAVPPNGTPDTGFGYDGLG